MEVFGLLGGLDPACEALSLLELAQFSFFIIQREAKPF